MHRGTSAVGFKPGFLNEYYKHTSHSSRTEQEEGSDDAHLQVKARVLHEPPRRGTVALRVETISAARLHESRARHGRHSRALRPQTRRGESPDLLRQRIHLHSQVCVQRFWRQLRPEMNNEINFIPIRLCFINVYTYANPKNTPYRN